MRRPGIANIIDKDKKACPECSKISKLLRQIEADRKQLIEEAQRLSAKGWIRLTNSDVPLTILRQQLFIDVPDVFTILYNTLVTEGKWFSLIEPIPDTIKIRLKGNFTGNRNEVFRVDNFSLFKKDSPYIHPHVDLRNVCVGKHTNIIPASINFSRGGVMDYCLGKVAPFLSTINEDSLLADTSTISNKSVKEILRTLHNLNNKRDIDSLHKYLKSIGKEIVEVTI